MPLPHRVLITVTTMLALAAVWRPANAQQSPADTAGVLLGTARRAEAEGRRDLAARLLRFLVEHYPNTGAAAEAQERLAALRQVGEAGSGRVGLNVWGTIFTSWLGIAIPAALGAEDPAPFGAGLLIGGPVGFLSSRALGRSRATSGGQAGAIFLGSLWGTVQGIGWRAVFDIGNETRTVCPTFGGGCFEVRDASDTAPFAGAVIGGLTGLASGLALASTRDIAAGDASLTSNATLWGALFGLGAGVLASDDDDVVLAWSLAGGNVGLLTGVLGSRAWHGSAGRAHLISAAGLAGAAAGFGVDLLLDIERNEAVIAPMLGSALGLIAGTALTRDHDRVDLSSKPRDRGMALLSLGENGGIGFPTPQPTVLPVVGPEGRLRVTPAVALRLFEMRF